MAGAFQSDAFQNDAFQVDAAGITFTADAVIRRAQSGSFTADAAIRTGGSGSITANAVLKKTQTVGLRFRDVVLGLSGLVGYWRFLEGTGTSTADYGPNGLTLTKTGPSTTWGGSLLGGGQAGGSFAFDSFTRWTHADTSLLDLGDVMTIVAVVKPTNITSQRAIVSKGNGTYYFRMNAGHFAGLKSQTAGIFEESTTRTSGQTYLASWTKNGSANHLWIDGADVTPTVTNATLVDNALEFAIGQDIGNEGFVGSIGDIAIFNRALTAAEELLLYTAYQGAAGLTFDSVIASVGFSGSFTANAVLRKSGTGSLTADAVLRKLAITADADIKRVMLGSATVDAVVAERPPHAFTADALVSTRFTGSFTAQAAITTFTTGGDPGSGGGTGPVGGGPGGIGGGPAGAGAWSGGGDNLPPEPQVIVITLDGADVTADVRITTATFISAVNGGPGQCLFEIKDLGHDYSPITGKTVTLHIDGILYWSGWATKITRMFAFPVDDTTDSSTTERFYRVEGVDLNMLFQKRIVYNKANPAKGALPPPAANQAPGKPDAWKIDSQVEDVVPYLLDHYTDLPGDAITYDITPFGTTNPDLEAAFSAAVTVGALMRDLNRLLQGVYYITPGRVFTYHDADTITSSYYLTDRPELIGDPFAIGPRDYSFTSDSGAMVNDALVWGAALGYNAITFHRTTDDDDSAEISSVTDHGLWQWADFSQQMYKQASVNRRADSVVYGVTQSQKGARWDRVYVTATVFDPVFMVGDVVNILSSTYDDIQREPFEAPAGNGMAFGPLAIALPIRRMEITFPTKDHARFKLTLTREIDEPWNTFESLWRFPPFPIPRFDIPPINLPPTPTGPYCPAPSGLLTTAFSDDFERTSGQPNGAAYGWYQDSFGDLTEPDIVNGATLVEFSLSQTLKRPISGDREIVLALDLTAWGTTAFGATFQISAVTGLNALIDWDGTLTVNVSRFDGIDAAGFSNTGAVDTDVLWGKVFVRVLDVQGVGAFMKVWPQAGTEPAPWDVIVSAPDGHLAVMFGATMISDYAWVEGWAINGSGGGPAAFLIDTENVDEFGLLKTWPFADPMDGRSYAVAWGSDSVTRDNYANPGYSASMAWGEFTNYGPGYLNGVNETFASRATDYHHSFAPPALTIDEPSAIRVGGEVSVSLQGHIIPGTTPATPTNITVGLRTFDFGEDDPSGYSDWEIPGTAEGSVAFSMAIEDTNTWEPFDFISNGGLSLHHWQWGVAILDPETTLRSLGPATGGLFLPTSASMETSLRNVFFEAEYGPPLGAPNFCVQGGGPSFPVGMFGWEYGLELFGNVVTLMQGFQPGTTQVVVNGITQRPGIDYTEDPAANQIVFTDPPPDPGDQIDVGYVSQPPTSGSTSGTPYTPVPPGGAGIIIDPVDLMALPTSGTAWNAVMSHANSSDKYTLASQDSNGNVACLARALVAARTGNKTYRDAVLADLRYVQTTTPDRTLALGRELGIAPIAADLINATEDELPGFATWLTSITSDTFAGEFGGNTLLETASERPNNWGCHAMGALAATYVYLGDTSALASLATKFYGWLGDRGSYAGFSYGDLSWQSNPSLPVGINPVGATLSGHNVDGVLPDDQRRGGGFTWPPFKENYVWEALQGAVMAAHIFNRAGYPMWAASDQALRRALVWLHDQDGFPASGDDTWVPWLVNYAYGTSFPAPSPSNPGKNFGYTDWLFG